MRQPIFGPEMGFFFCNDAFAKAVTPAVGRGQWCLQQLENWINL
jgi:hypothetical protein